LGKWLNGDHGFVEGAAEKDADKMAFVFGAAFMVVDQVRAVRDESGSLWQTFFNFRTRAR
jgi:hypothetical protein